MPDKNDPFVELVSRIFPDDQIYVLPLGMKISSGKGGSLTTKSWRSYLK